MYQSQEVSPPTPALEKARGGRSSGSASNCSRKTHGRQEGGERTSSKKSGRAAVAADQKHHPAINDRVIRASNMST